MVSQFHGHVVVYKRYVTAPRFQNPVKDGIVKGIPDTGLRIVEKRVWLTDDVYESRFALGFQGKLVAQNMKPEYVTDLFAMSVLHYQFASTNQVHVSFLRLAFNNFPFRCSGYVCFPAVSFAHEYVR